MRLSAVGMPNPRSVPKTQIGTPIGFAVLWQTKREIRETCKKKRLPVNWWPKSERPTLELKGMGFRRRSLGRKRGTGRIGLTGVSEGYRKHVGNFAAQFQESFFQLPIDLLAPTSPSNQQQTIIVAWVFVFPKTAVFGLACRLGC